MKKHIIRKVSLAFLCAASLASCDVLDVEPLDSYTEDVIFRDAKLTEAYVTMNYTRPRNGWSRYSLRFCCDESMENFNYGGAWTINTGGMTPDQLGPLDIWANYYSYIKNCNIFFNNLENLNSISEDKRNILIGEATFFRAYYYMELVNNYGGVPLITRLFQLDDPEMMVERDSYDDCVKFIVDEFSKAADLLPTKFSGTDFGRVTKGAALAMKARMLLYAASPLWNPDNDRAKWQAAAEANKEVIDLGLYSLDPDYKGLFLNAESPEIIFQRLYNTEFGEYYDWYNSPNGWGGYSCTAVLQEMVDSYEMEDGSMPDASIYANATENPWAGRDPRLYASIVCDGQDFRGREIEFWVNADGETGGTDSEFGRDAWNYSKTHYTIRKFMDESLLNSWSDKGSQPWVYCRLAEIYLNYAEALFHLGDETGARKYVNLVRERARGGNSDILPDVTAAGEDLLKKIRHERKVELAFEEHRFYDVRRWKIAEDTDSGEFHGINITKNPDGTKKYELFKIQDRLFKASNYLLPIPNYERRRNDLLVQNPGY
ncbi:MAG: RagB/SusD family nutrient uptake outer membrane protein [Muribaculaceae bacterium]|nr:RagB/SusD family nutrient uptake outer membrane protein [Muribaculaceae bacterium]MDE5712946.1 RagB/SusD family nutrient uptake outer membrane protein [Muribaculaceae bacterium]